MLEVHQLKLILASKSPRRKELLETAGFQFKVKTKEVDESFPSDLPVLEVAEYIAKKKATASIDLLESGHILLTADSVVILGQTIYGKPKDEAAARATLRALSGNHHTVVTGVCLVSAEQEVHFSGISEVYFHELSDAEIDFYIKNFNPYDKAGSYGIQEWIGWCKVRRIEGTYANIMGLPVDLVFEKLKAFLPKT